MEFVFSLAGLLRPSLLLLLLWLLLLLPRDDLASLLLLLVLEGDGKDDQVNKVHEQPGGEEEDVPEDQHSAGNNMW